MPIFRDQQMCRCAMHSRDGFHSKNAPTHYPPDLMLEPKHRDIALFVDPEAETAEGTVTTTVEARSATSRSLELDAVDFEELEVTDADGNELSFTYDGKKIRATWAEAFEPGESRRLVVKYRVEKPVAGLYFSHPTNDQPDLPRWAATDHETERARYWLPCVDHLNVRTTLSFHLRADASYTILANGAQQQIDEHDDGTKTVHWELDFPCPSYLVCFALGEFTEATDGEFSGIPVAYYAADHYSPRNLELSFGRTREMLEWMTAKLGQDFPFPKYYQFALPGIGGAMENISLVSWDEIFVLDEDLAREWTWLVDQINVHEMAHSYFGDAVVCREFAHVWLKESWATYMEQCWLEDRYGDDEKLYDFYRNAEAYFQEADSNYKRAMVTRTFDSSWDMYDRHLYPGGACRLHTLRNELGDVVFWSAVSDYLSEHIGGVVETEDFRRAMERESGRSLTRFFQQWFYTADYPHLAVKFDYDSEKSEGTFTIEQKQAGSDEKTEGYTFQLRLELSWVSDGTRTTETVEIDDARRTYRFDMATEPQMVAVDPHGKVLHKQEFNPGDAKLLAQLTDGETVLERIRAARELGKTGKRKNLKGIVDAYHDEEFWGVRQQFASALADAGTAFAIESLAQLVESEQDPMVIAHVIGRAGQFRDERVAEAVANRVAEGDLAPWALLASYKALGSQRGAADVETLREAARRSTFHDIAQSGAIEALAETRRTEVFEVLQELTARTVGRRARSAAAAAIGRLGAVMENREREQAREVLEDLLRDDEEIVAKAAANALARMGARESVGALGSLEQRVSHQEAVAIRRVVEKIHKGDDDKVASLEKQLEEIRGDFRKLAERLEKLEPNDA